MARFLFDPRLLTMAIFASSLSMTTSGPAAAAPAAGTEARSAGKRAAPTDLGGLDPALYARARHAFDKARSDGVVRRPRLVVIDYSLPSTEKRLWIFDTATHRLLFKELVAHGKNSGDNAAHRFSNTPGSLQTSLGVFVTDNVYRGKHGKSLRLNGLEQGFNDRARERAIVIHGADYVDDKQAKKQGRLGRSWGCPAVRSNVASAIIDAIAGGAVIFAWGDDQDWQKRSAFLR